MRGAWLLLLLLGCGGRIAGDGTQQQPDASASADGDPLGGGGKLNSGPCQFTVTFTPHGQPPVQTADVKNGTATASRSGTMLEITCVGTGQDTFYYALDITGVTTAAGDQKGMGTLNQTTNGREGEMAVGGCTVNVVISSDKTKLNGTFDCSMYDDPIGTFDMKGTFSVPNP